MAAVSPEWLSELGSEAPTEAQWELIERVFFAPRGFFADQTDARAAAASFREFYTQFIHRRANQRRAKAPEHGGGGGGGGVPAERCSLNLPRSYDPQYKLNFSILDPAGSASDPHGLDRPEVSAAAARVGLRRERLKAVRLLFHMHEDFAQKKSLAALRKSAADRRALPVTLPRSFQRQRQRRTPARQLAYAPPRRFRQRHCGIALIKDLSRSSSLRHHPSAPPSLLTPYPPLLPSPGDAVRAPAPRPLAQRTGPPLVGRSSCGV